MDSDVGHDVADDSQGVASVFGRPYRSPSGTLVIPVARVVHVYRPGSETGANGEPVRVVTAAPRAVLEIDENGVRLKEVVNSTLLGFSGILLMAWNVFWIAKTVRAFAKKR